MSKPWGNIGAWAAEAEQAEAEEREAAAAAAAAAPPARVEPQNFPSLREAVSAKPKKKKMSLNEFYSAGSQKGLTPDEMMRLPTGPKERSAEEMQYGRLGGGFSNYGRTGPPPNRGREEGDTSWGGGGGRRSYGGFEDDRHGAPLSRVSEFDQPSRADEVDNWAMTKKPLPSLDSTRQTRYDSLGGGSRADDVDNWALGKKPQPPPPSRSFGSGFRDSGVETDRWNRGGGGGGFHTERPKLVLDPPKGDSVGNEVVKSTKASPFGAARPREEVLAEKGLDYRKLESDIEAKKTSRPTSAQSSRPSSAQSSRSETQGLQGIENVVKPRPKVNPFGEAKPREVLLEEKGMDWRKIDFELEHRRVDRPQTELEKMLKEEIENMKEMEKELAHKANNENSQGSEGDQPSLSDAISLKEKELETLTRDLDDKVRFGQKSVERPGSGYGRSGSFSDRPPSRSGSIDESRSVDYNGRPSSRGMGDAWSRSGNDRRPFQGGRDRGFLASRDSDRSRSRERW
ncbi:hypothetical protein BT93_B2854 [Corymbia citriodora subsp. variegata]|nr:hypothetical protein BT93_B2854 [Corymbia citriodora subsp. variegata]